ncbi:cuticle protein 16.5-like isoform X1 [Aethina tumida]|uniref:cuticle protein 16.5-like isoform X1 n=1 Tax=Aethina tumida TaxID=116153 RepID=UPI002147FB18|nr:cuticle protein 16.5-like isoform X1 [Aethina tumida]
MNSFAVVATFLAALACAQAGLLVGPSAKVLQGPSTKTTVVGPDGSAISSVAPGGQIITEEHPGVVAQTAPVVAAPVLAHSAHLVAHSAPVLAHSAPVVAAHAAPVLAHSAPVLAHSAPVLAHSAPLLAHSAPVVAAHHGLVAHGAEQTVVSGPSGVIATGRSVAPAAVVSHGVPHAAVIGHGVHGIHEVHGVHGLVL